jgi:hypothetical protein
MNPLSAINEPGRIQKVEPFFVVAGAEECLFGVFEGVKKEVGEQFRGQFGFEQSAGVVNHIESAASKMVVRICRVEFIHILHALQDTGRCPPESTGHCGKFAQSLPDLWIAGIALAGIEIA